MQSNNERGASQALQSRSRADATPTGRVIGDTLPFLFTRPRRYCSLMMEQEARRAGVSLVMVALEMDLSSIEARIAAVYPEAARYLKP